MLLIVRKYQSNESKSLSIETRRTTCHLCSALGTSLSLRLRKVINPPILLPISLLPPSPTLSNRQPSIHRMVYTKHESRGESVGSFPSIPRRSPRSRSSDFRNKWHTISSSARGLLCFHAYKNHWPSDNKVALHTPSRSKSTISQPSSRDTTAPWNVVHGRSFQVHTEKVAEHEESEATWDDEMTTATTTTEFSQPGSKPSSEAAASVNASLIEESGARRPGLATRLYDDHMAAPLYFNGSRTRAEEAEYHIATGDSVDALIDALLQIGDSGEYDSASSPGTMSFYSYSDPEDAGLEQAIDDKSMVCGVGEENRSAGAAWEDADARRAWEDMKRQVMHIEEFGALPLPPDGAGAGDAERASREFRARRRRSWAEETIRGQVREEAKRKKRRRNAGCWVREDGVFMRLVRHSSTFISSFFIMSFTSSFFLFGIHGLTIFYLLSQYARRM
jgi:hypothetical protein